MNVIQEQFVVLMIYKGAAYRSYQTKNYYCIIGNILAICAHIVKQDLWHQSMKALWKAFLMKTAFKISGVGWLQKHISPDDEVIDFGCGLMTITRHLRCSKLIGIDAWEPYIERLGNELIDARHIYLCYFELNKKTLSLMDSKSTDICLAIDVVEHFKKPDAVNLILEMERIARKRVIVFTPLGFLPMEDGKNGTWGAGNPKYQKHRCGFLPGEFAGEGYETYTRIGGDIPSFLAVKTLKLKEEN